MRLRNFKEASQIIENSNYIVLTPIKYKDKWHDLFGNNNPIHIEIGMGKGKFILESALKYPNINFIGIEKYDSIIAKAIIKIEQYEISNLRVIRMDANYIDEVFKKELERIYLNFSDPWPKERHAKRRLTSDRFLYKYENIFKGTKHIFMKTDNKSLFDYSKISFTDYGYQLINISYDLAKTKLSANIITEYEEKFMTKKAKIYYLEAYKS